MDDQRYDINTVPRPRSICLSRGHYTTYGLFRSKMAISGVVTILYLCCTVTGRMRASKHLRVVRPACPESRRTPRTRVFPSAFGLARVSFQRSSRRLVPRRRLFSFSVGTLARLMARALASAKLSHVCIFDFGAFSACLSFFFRDIIQMLTNLCGCTYFGIEMTPVRIVNVATVALCQLKR
jgi:hypothetical protein